MPKTPSQPPQESKGKILIIDDEDAILDSLATLLELEEYEVATAATAGDGWHPTGLSPEDFILGAREINELAEAAGRDSKSITMSMRVEVEVHGGPSSARAADRARVPGDDPGQMIAALEAYQSAGVEHAVLALNSGDIPSVKTLMERIAKDVIPHFK